MADKTLFTPSELPPSEVKPYTTTNLNLPLLRLLPTSWNMSARSLARTARTLFTSYEPLTAAELVRKHPGLTQFPLAGFTIPYFGVDGKVTKFFRYRYLEKPVHSGFLPSSKAAADAGTMTGATAISDAFLTSPGTAVGTVACMSPEQAKGIPIDGGTPEIVQNADVANRFALISLNFFSGDGKFISMGIDTSEPGPTTHGRRWRR